MSLPPSSRADPAWERSLVLHLPLVREVVRRCSGRPEEFNELVRIGVIGLIKAADRFDPTRGVVFTVAATPAIEREIRRHLWRRRWPLHRTRHGKLPPRLERSPRLRELAAALEADEHDVECALTAALATDARGVKRALAKERPRDSIPNSSKKKVVGRSDASTSVAIRKDQLVLATSVRALDSQERRMLYLHYYLGMSERQIARAVGISQAQVLRLVDRALTRLRNELPSSGRVASRTAGRGRPLGGSSAPPQRSARAAGNASPAPSPARGRGKARTTTAAPDGGFLVDMPSPLHEQLAREAERQHLSVNEFVTDVLAASVASTSAAQSPASVPPPSAAVDPATRSQRRPVSAFRMALAATLVVVVLTVVLALALLVLALQRGI